MNRIQISILLAALTCALPAKSDLFGGSNSFFRKPLGDTGDTLQNVVNTTTEILTNGQKRITQEFTNGVKVATEQIPGAAPLVTVMFPNGVTQVTQDLDLGVKLITETFPEGEKRVTKLLADGSKTITETLRDGYVRVFDETANGTKIFTQVFANGNKVVTQILKDGTRTVTEVLSEASKTYLATLKLQQDLLNQQVSLVEQTASEALDVAKAIERFNRRQISGIGDSIGSAERRLREGKVVDAIWGLNIEQYQNTDNNAAQAALENKYIASAGQLAATTYGGPAGGAAYTAWLTYKATGDAELALKQGVLSGVVSAVGSGIADMPSGTTTEVAKKVSASAAFAAAQASASGAGSEEAIRGAIYQQISAQAAQGLIDLPPNFKDTPLKKALADASIAGAKAMVTTFDEQSAESAIRASLITSVTNNITEQLPTEQMRQVKKAATVAAITALTVAASGGNERAVLDAVAASGQILVQDEVEQLAVALRQEASDAGKLYYMKIFDGDPDEVELQISHMKDAFGDMQKLPAQWGAAITSRTDEMRAAQGYPPLVQVEGDTQVLAVANGEWTVSYLPRNATDGASTPVILTFTGPKSSLAKQQAEKEETLREVQATLRDNTIYSR
ncbi:hypothetical protein [Pseudomonas huaxiensis]|uniref:hypothetical protein n=1 Tax=Pseudomonas huaxiensis TaxID=2213017 RepID=UPI000DA6A80B|nr:hypothetical protein [Pseudomonas huaxiensis]